MGRYVEAGVFQSLHVIVVHGFFDILWKANHDPIFFTFVVFTTQELNSDLYTHTLYIITKF